MPLTLQTTLRGHTDRVWCCAWSPSGKALATSSGDKQIRIWVQDPAKPEEFTCKQVLEGTHSRTVRWVSWSPNGKLLASAGFDGITAIWENQNGEFECIATLEGHENEVKCVSWCRSGNLLATCSRDKSVWIWAADSEKDFECLSVLNGHTQDVKVAKWHPIVESCLFSASYDNTIKIWTEEDDDWYCTETLTAHSSTVWGLTFSPSADEMASCSDDHSIIIWKKGGADTKKSTDENTSITTQNAGGWSVGQTLKDHHTRCIFSVDWSKKGFIASGAADDNICIFGSSSTAAPTADTNTPATADTKSSSDIRLLHTEKKAHAGDVNCVAWNPVQPDVLCSAGDDGLVKVWKFSA